MRFTHNDLNFTIAFQHAHKDRNRALVPFKRNGVTICRIIQWDARKEHPVAVLTGIAQCSKKDPYVKAIGRGLSFENALKLAEPLLARAASTCYYGRQR